MTDKEEKVSAIAAYVFDDKRRMYAGVFTLKNTKFRKNRHNSDLFMLDKDRDVIAKIIRETQPDAPWKPFYPEHAYTGKLWVEYVFELVWFPDIHAPTSMRWRFENAFEMIKVHPPIADTSPTVTRVL